MTYSPELLDLSPFESAVSLNAFDKNTGFRIVATTSEPNGDKSFTQGFRAVLGNVSMLFFGVSYEIDGTQFYRMQFSFASILEKRFAPYFQNWSEFVKLQYLAKGAIATHLFYPMIPRRTGYYVRYICVVISPDEIDKCPDEVRRTYPRSPKGDLIVSAGATKPPAA